MNTDYENTAGWSLHPRPQLMRDNFYILKGEWTLDNNPINIPYPPQSSLAKYDSKICNKLVYEHKFILPRNFTKERILLHFGAVDQVCKVFVNDVCVGKNQGGYIPFSFDITATVNRNGENTLKVIAADTLSKDYPYGKQCENPHGMWYTPISGIWQNVWLENVPNVYIQRIIMDTDLDSVTIKLELSNNQSNFDTFDSSPNKPDPSYSEYNVKVALPNGEILSRDCNNLENIITIPNPVNWTPDSPYLYNILITVGEDVVQSYFALRTIKIKNIDGINRVCLNNTPIFLHGVLDQGYFHDGIFLPKDERHYDRDILAMKELGFNLLRKHIKIEPEYFYYACDRLGMLVMQDMVNSGPYSYVRDTVLPTIGLKRNIEANLPKTNRRRIIFETQTRLTIEHLYNHPSIISYTIFNEGWGQFNSDEMYDFVKSLDSSRLIDTTSGWFAKQKNDFDSRHIYFRNKALKVKSRPLFVTECGGYQLMDKEHFFGTQEYGYGTCHNKIELTDKIIKMMKK